MLEGLHHVAYRCLDAGETVDFYTNVIGLKFAHAISQDRVPSTQEFSPHLHIFFELGDGSYLAFFELAKAPLPQRDPNTPDWAGTNERPKSVVDGGVNPQQSGEI